MRRSVVLCAVGLLAFAVSPLAQADVVLPNVEPGQTIPIANDPTQHNGFNPIGTLAASSGQQLFFDVGGGETLRGRFVSEVYQEAGGTLDFYYQVQLTGSAPVNTSLTFLDALNFLPSSVSSPGGVDTGTVSNVALIGASGIPAACGFDTNPACTPVTLVAPRTGTVSPTSVTYLNNGTGTLQYSFIPGIPGDGGIASYTIAISTNDTLFNVGEAIVTGNGSPANSESLLAFQPVDPPSSTPEPVSVVLLGTVMALLALFVRRRQRAKASKA